MTDKSMTVAEARDALLALKDKIGERADVYLTIKSERGRDGVDLSVYADGLCGGMTFLVSGNDWHEAIANGEAKWSEQEGRVHNDLIERMALEIIKVTSRKGECGPADLRAAKFTQKEILRHGMEACDKADSMAKGGPFNISPEEPGQTPPD